MTDIMKTLSGKSAFLIPWLFAALLFVGAGALFLFPAAQRHGLDIGLRSLSEAALGLLLAAATIALGIVISSASTPLYRVLEGYSWPRRFRDWGIRRQRERRTRLESKYKKAPSGSPESALAYENLGRYPTNDLDFLPTRLGNAIRAFELYGDEHYCLSSQALWSDLLGVVPKYVQDDVDNGRTGCDFAVALTFLSMVYGLAAVGLGALSAYQGRFDIGSWVQVLALALWPLTYRLAVLSTDYWGQTVHALVDLGRKPLALAIGVPFPMNLQTERELWQAFSDFTYSPYSTDLANRLDAVVAKSQLTTPGAPSATSPATVLSAEAPPSRSSNGCVLFIATFIGVAIALLNRRSRLARTIQPGEADI
jgi:hypothetical protein